MVQVQTLTVPPAVGAPTGQVEFHPSSYSMTNLCQLKPQHMCEELLNFEHIADAAILEGFAFYGRGEIICRLTNRPSLCSC